MTVAYKPIGFESIILITAVVFIWALLANFCQFMEAGKRKKKNTGGGEGKRYLVIAQEIKQQQENPFLSLQYECDQRGNEDGDIYKCTSYDWRLGARVLVNGVTQVVALGLITKIPVI